MEGKKVVYNVAEVKSFSPEGSEESYSSRLLVDRENVGSEKMVMNEFTLKAGKQTYKGNHGKGFDEIYYVLSGKALLYLQEMGTSDYQEYNLCPRTYAFIKGGRGHYITNPYNEDIVLLTIMAKHPNKGVNLLYDARKAKWGTSFQTENP
jgi:oxalate decarboxylase/phosphoglucose isomerase-like protein (cupin superfamily)